jgi:APA family basic amino acid/polyamine antiporter
VIYCNASDGSLRSSYSKVNGSKDGESAAVTAASGLARRLGPFDAAMIVMGGIVGSGIFMNPYVVAQRVHSTPLILGCWLLGGLVALAGAFIYAELAAQRPYLVGGQYAYLREAYHPAVGFVYGWALLLVVQTGGMAAVAVTFARYFREITHLPLADWLVAAGTLGVLTVINCVGVRAGSAVQNVLMVIKILAIVLLVVFALSLVGMPNMSFTPALDRPVSFGLVAAFAAAMGPVMFSYGGWHTASFVAAEMRRPERDLSRGLLIGVIGVVVLYVAANVVYVGVLGAAGLARSTAPASSVMRLALGERGARLIAVGIGISTLGFLSQSMLTAPRVYFAMAEDKLFFKSVAWVGPRSRVPVIAIALQGVLATVIALSGTFEQILNYVVSVDFIAYGLTATCLFVFRRREPQLFGGSTDGVRAAESTRGIGYRVPGHPYTTIFFTAVCWSVVAGTVFSYPRNTAIGLAIVLAGIPVYFFWRWWRRDD